MSRQRDSRLLAVPLDGSSRCSGRCDAKRRSYLVIGQRYTTTNNQFQRYCGKSTLAIRFSAAERYAASVKAALKFKYKPRVVDGEAIEVAGVQNKFTYTLEN